MAKSTKRWVDDTLGPWGTNERAEAARTSALAIIATATVLALLWWLRAIFIPVTFAWLLKVAFTPFVRRMRHFGINPPIAASLVLVGGLAASATAVYLLASPASVWLEQLPDDIESVRRRLESAQGDVAPLKKVAESIDSLSEVGSTTEGEPGKPRPVKVELEPSSPGMVGTLQVVQSYVAQFFIIAVLAYFMLASDRVLLAKWVALSRTRSARRRAVRTVHAIERHCSRYVLTISVINAVLGVCVGMACWLLGLGQPLLWGAMAAVLNYVPFLGALVGIGIVALAGLTTIQDLPQALFPALAYLGLTTLEGGVITPAIIGRQIRMSPVVVLIWILLWGWLWGVPGILLALPMLAAVVIVCRNVPEWRGIATLVEG